MPGPNPPDDRPTTADLIAEAEGVRGTKSPDGADDCDCDGCVMRRSKVSRETAAGTRAVPPAWITYQERAIALAYEVGELTGDERLINIGLAQVYADLARNELLARNGT